MPRGKLRQSGGIGVAYSYIGFLAVLGRLYARSLRMLGDNEHPAAGIILQRLEQQAICMAGPEISLERGKVFFSFQKIECPHLPHAISSTALKIGGYQPVLLGYLRFMPDIIHHQCRNVRFSRMGYAFKMHVYVRLYDYRAFLALYYVYSRYAKAERFGAAYGNLCHFLAEPYLPARSAGAYVGAPLAFFSHPLHGSGDFVPDYKGPYVFARGADKFLKHYRLLHAFYRLKYRQGRRRAFCKHDALA